MSAKDIFKSQSQVSISTPIATRIGFKNRSPIVISAVDEPINRASHVEITFRDEYLTRADMWGLVVAKLANKTIYKNQRITFMGTIKVLIKTIFARNGQKVQDAFFDASTKPIFRSESARYVLFIQMSKEMWDFDADGTGEIMFNKVINGFLPELFKRWGELGVKHLVSIVLFTRLEYERGLAASFVHTEMNPRDSGPQAVNGNTSYKDFYRVVVSDMASSEWARILRQLKAEFKVFLRDVSIRKPLSGQYLSLGTGLTTSTDLPTHIIGGYPSAAVRGNILEAINLASSQFSCDHIDRDLVRTGISISVVTASTGVFEVDYKSLMKTTENLIENGVSIDLVCLSRMPLHSVPLFKYWQESQPREGRTSLDGSNEQGPYVANFQSFSDGRRHDSMSQSTFCETDAASSSAGVNSSKAGCWKYGIPHWIDVSFWTSSSDEDRTQAAILGKLRNKADPIKRLQKSFVPRVRLYELQMMGVMEDVKISIPYLFCYGKAPSNSHGLFRESQKSDKNNHFVGTQIAWQAEFGDNKSVTHKSLDVPHTGSMNTRIHESRLQSSQWMDEYDDMIFRHPRQRRMTAVATGYWKQQPLGRISHDRRRRDYSPLKLGSSPSAHSMFIDRRSGLEGKVATELTMKDRHSIQTHAHKRGSISSMIPNNNSSAKKPTQLSRQISFGPRGFIGTLKAHASTELTAEHANSASLLSRGLRSNTSSKAKYSITPESRSTRSRSINSQVSVNLSPEQQDNLDGLIIPDSISPRPIPIRKVTALRHAKEDMKMPEEKDSVQEMFFSSANTEEQSQSSRQGILNDAYDFSKSASPSSSMAPWLTIINPSNPHKTDNTLGGQLGRWQHVFPHPLRTSKIKWKSLCSPAAVPLTTEEYPSAGQIAEEYEESQYRVTPLDEANVLETPRSQDWLLREMMACRFSHGFQIVIGSKLAQTFGLSPVQTIDVFEDRFSFERGSTIFMSKGGTIHQLSYIDGGGIDVRSLTRRTMSFLTSRSEDNIELYKPAIRAMLVEEYKSQEIEIFPARKDVDWETLDSFVASREKPHAERFADTLHSWRARFVLIPVDPPSSGRRPLHPINEDDEEEVRLEGIRKLTQVWQRFRYVPSTERRFQASTRRRKDTNPLDIMYRTLDPSAIVAAELDSIGENNPAGKPIQLLPESDLYQRSNVNLVALAQAIQSERGVRMMDRRWHWRLHYNCFIGFELTTWILQYFRDVETRDEAVEIGNDLMSRGLFQHVEQRHNFRDGNFFYQIASEYRAPRPESSRNWFGSRKADKSVPSTPLSEGNSEDSPKLPCSRASSTGEGHSDSETSTPTESKQHLGVTLSKSLLYDVDHRRRSHRPEVVNLHYDRLHNPDNCYHICLEWMNVTAKLIEDAVVSWATLVDRFGLRLVELPLGEAATITKMHPFRAPYLLTLSKYPPGKQPQTFFDATSFAPQDRTEKHFYQKAILKKFNFVLDFEAAKDFPPDVDVAYSWGKPDYQYSQYIHRSGALIAQITDDGDFLLLANRLYNNRSAPGQEPLVRTDGNETQAGSTRSASTRSGNHRLSPRASPHLSPSVRATPDMPSASTGFARSGQTTAFSTPEQISKELETFCRDADGLTQFYSELLRKSASPGPNTPFMESSIPALGLPPSLSLKEGSPTPKPKGSGNKTNTASSSSPKPSVADSSSSHGGD